MFLRIGLVGLSVFTLGIEFGAASSLITKHVSRSAIPANWELSHRAPEDFILPLRIGLAQQNLHLIEEVLLNVSHPDSPNYGNHWTATDIRNTFRPSALSTQAVQEWLTSEEIAPSRISLSQSGAWVEANISVAEAERLLKTEYHVYNHVPTGVEHILCGGGYHLPEHVVEHVDLILPTLDFDVKLGKQKLKRMKRSEIKNSKPDVESRSPKTGEQLKVCVKQFEYVRESLRCPTLVGYRWFFGEL
jgi:tripeptidyl-peptidase I